MTDENKTSFIKITNKDIYHEIKTMHENNETQHANILRHLECTNGKVKLNRWIASTALMIALMAIGWIMTKL